MSICVIYLVGPFLNFTRTNNSKLDFNEGDENVTISCIAHGYKIPDVSIYFENEMLTNTEVMTDEQELTKTVSFTFDRLTRGNNGTYTCKVDDKNITESLDLIVYCKFFYAFVSKILLRKFFFFPF